MQNPCQILPLLFNKASLFFPTQADRRSQVKIFRSNKTEFAVLKNAAPEMSVQNTAMLKCRSKKPAKIKLPTQKSCQKH
jgi:hypothetical protein